MAPSKSGQQGILTESMFSFFSLRRNKHNNPANSPGSPPLSPTTPDVVEKVKAKSLQRRKSLEEIGALIDQNEEYLGDNGENFRKRLQELQQNAPPPGKLTKRGRTRQQAFGDQSRSLREDIEKLLSKPSEHNARTSEDNRSNSGKRSASPESSQTPQSPPERGPSRSGSHRAKENREARDDQPQGSDLKRSMTQTKSAFARYLDRKGDLNRSDSHKAYDENRARKEVRLHPPSEAELKLVAEASQKSDSQKSKGETKYPRRRQSYERLESPRDKEYDRPRHTRHQSDKPDYYTDRDKDRNRDRDKYRHDGKRYDYRDRNGKERYDPKQGDRKWEDYDRERYGRDRREDRERRDRDKPNKDKRSDMQRREEKVGPADAKDKRSDEVERVGEGDQLERDGQVGDEPRAENNERAEGDGKLEKDKQPETDRRDPADKRDVRDEKYRREDRNRRSDREGRDTNKREDKYSRDYKGRGYRRPYDDERYYAKDRRDEKYRRDDRERGVDKHQSGDRDYGKRDYKGRREEQDPPDEKGRRDRYEQDKYRQRDGYSKDRDSDESRKRRDKQYTSPKRDKSPMRIVRPDEELPDSNPYAAIPISLPGVPRTPTFVAYPESEDEEPKPKLPYIRPTVHRTLDVVQEEPTPDHPARERRARRDTDRNKRSSPLTTNKAPESRFQEMFSPAVEKIKSLPR